MLPLWYNEYKEIINNLISLYLEKYLSSENNLGFHQFKNIIKYSLNGGKRIRSILALEFYLIFSNSDKTIKDLTINDKIVKFFIAIELLHAYSLIHDDLPAMDNDEYRRGNLTVWKKYGETNAILAGDLLQTIAFEILSEVGDIEIIKYFSQSIGLKGMLGGQVLDLFYEKKQELLNLDNLIEIHNKKTGALIEFSIVGAIILTGKKENLDLYKKFGQQIGLAFQIKDDLLDVEGTLEETGKSVGNGEEKGFVYFMGLDKTKIFLNNLINNSKKIIKNLNSNKLNFIISYIENRKI